MKLALIQLLTAILTALLLFACAPRDRALAQMTPIGTWQRSDQVRLSAGCEPASGPEGQAVPESVTVRGSERSYLARIPETYTPGRPHDFVVAFHGRTNPNSQVRAYFDLDEALPEAIIVYPSAMPHGSGFRWSDPGDLPGELRDFALFDALLVSFGNAYCLDLDRVFVVGHSLGASFANSVACSRGGPVRAVASVAGGIEGAPCDGGAAALIVHHPEDALVPISAGERARDAFVAANAVAGPAVLASEPELAALACVRYGSDSPDPVVWCAHDDALTYGGRYYPHNWPDAVPQAIARFFRDLPRGPTGTQAGRR